MSSFEVNSAAGEAGRKLPQFIAGLAASGGALAAGTYLGWTSPAEIPLVRDGEYGFEITTEEFSWVGSIANLGAALVCFPIGVLMKLIGRKWAMLSMVVPLVVGWALVIWASNVAMMMVGRLLLGIGGGAFCIAAPMYTAEIAQPSIRGTLGTFFQLLITIGILFVYGVGAAVNVQMLSIICGIIPIAFGVIFFFMPESPQYFVEKNRYDDASKSLKWLRGSRYDERAEIEELKANDDKMRAEKITFVQGFQQKSNIRALIVSLGLMFFQQMSGINVVIFYTTSLFESANTGLNATDATVIVGSIMFAATLLATFIMDKAGRRVLLLTSEIFSAIATILLAVYFQLKQSDPAQIADIGWLPILAVCLFIAMFSIGLGPIPWLMAGELFANNVKVYVSPIAGAFNWMLAFFVVKVFASLVDAMGSAGVFWLFSGFSLLGAAFVFFIVPETKGISLQEIQELLGGEMATPPSTGHDNPAFDEKKTEAQ